jgi:hypothetical protein
MKIESPELVQRQLNFQGGTFDRAKRSVDVVLATGQVTQMFDYKEWKPVMEKLSMNAAHIRMDRMQKGLPLLNVHRRDTMQDQLGKVINLRVEGDQILGTLQFSRRADVEDILNDVEDGIYDSVSIGYRVWAYEVTKREGQMDEYLAVDWEPLEGSLVPVPADSGARTRSCEMRSPGENAEQTAERMTVPDPKNENEERAMPAGNENEVKGLTQSDFDRLITQARGLGLGLDQVQAVMADAKEQKRDLASCMEALTALHVRKLADEATAKKTDAAPPVLPAQAARTEGGTDEREKDATAVMEYLHYRSSAKPEDLTDGAKKFLGNTMVDICRHILKTNGVNPEGRDRAETVRLAMGGALRKRDVGGLHTTSDFPELLGALTQRSLLSAYAATPDDYSQFVTPIVFSDPRAKSFVRVGGLGTLRTVGEGQEYKRVTFGESKEEVEIMKRGEIFALSYEAMLRDDLSAFTRLPAQFGMMSKLTESAVVYAVLTSNPVMSDTKTLFHADHGNIGSADSPDVSGITDARTLMRSQTDPSSGKRLGLKPFLVLAPYKYENGLSQIMADATLKPATLAEVIPGYIRDMKYVISDNLDEASTQVWYAVADPARIEGIVVGRLEGNRPFEIEQKVGWEVDGIEWKIRHWFGAGVVDYRGLYRNAGE